MRGRPPLNVELFRALATNLQLETGTLAKRVGKKPTNVSAYISGSKTPGKKTLMTAWRHAFEWEVHPIVEVREIKDHKQNVPTVPGIYALYDSSVSILYVGQATNLRAELNQTLNRVCNFPVRQGPNLSKKARPKYRDLATHLSAYEVQSARLRHNLEALLLRLFPNQAHNNKVGNYR
jgi:hypothetical protein